MRPLHVPVQPADIPCSALRVHRYTGTGTGTKVPAEERIHRGGARQRDPRPTVPTSRAARRSGGIGREYTRYTVRGTVQTCNTLYLTVRYEVRYPSTHIYIYIRTQSSTRPVYTSERERERERVRNIQTEQRRRRIMCTLCSSSASFLFRKTDLHGR